MSTLRLLAILFAGAVVFVGYGFYKVEYGNAAEGHQYIGYSTAFIFVVIMPIFIWLRYKNKDFSKFDFNHYQKKDEPKDPLDFDNDQLN